MRLSVYDFQIIYKKGEDNGSADALSRIPHNHTQFATDFNDVIISSLTTHDADTVVGENYMCAHEFNRSEQQTDQNLSWLHQLILDYGHNKAPLQSFSTQTQKNLFPEYDNFRLFDGVIYRTVEDSNGRMQDQFVLPLHLIDKTIEHVHGSLYGGHLGIKKTLEKISSRFFYNNLSFEHVIFYRTRKVLFFF